jgi:hypothetical protein
MMPQVNFEGLHDQQQHQPDDQSLNSDNENMQEANPNDLFRSPQTHQRGDIVMHNSSASSNTEDSSINQVCMKLQSKLQLDPEHLKIAILTSKVHPSHPSLSPPLFS